MHGRMGIALFSAYCAVSYIPKDSQEVCREIKMIKNETQFIWNCGS